mmetsp:Transcript_4244/g.14848  ORF Transcript_4244/g.14848 Transcript_4244/m.14848 type:complete len:301 (-) Transcript_4244:102-1004(-)
MISRFPTRPSRLLLLGLADGPPPPKQRDEGDDPEHGEHHEVNQEAEDRVGRRHHPRGDPQGPPVKAHGDRKALFDHPRQQALGHPLSREGPHGAHELLGHLGLRLVLMGVLRGVRVRRVTHRDKDVVRSNLHLEGLGEPLEGKLAGGVRRVAVEADLSGLGAHQNHPSALPAAHGREDRPDRVHSAEVVHRHEPLVLRARGVLHRFALRESRAADQDADGQAVGLLRPPNRGLDLVRPGDVRPLHNNPPCASLILILLLIIESRPETRGGLLELVLAPGHQGDPCSGLQELFGALQSYSA